MSDDLLFEYVKELRNEIVSMRKDMHKIHQDMRHGFAAIRQRHVSVDADITNHEHRLNDLENDISIIKSRLDLHEAD